MKRLVMIRNAALLFVLLLLWMAGGTASGPLHATAPAQRQQSWIPLLLRAWGPPQPIPLTILHTNDLHGNLEPDDRGRGGSAYLAGIIAGVRQQVGAENVALVDAGDSYLGAQPISQLLLGASTIDIYNMLGYDLSTYGNHEFDKGQAVTISRTLESDFPWIAANIVIDGTDWTTPDWSPPYVTMTLGAAGNEVVLGIIGLANPETALITLKGMTDGLIFKDPTETILHYYDEVRAQSDGMIVLAHIGTDDTGTFEGLKTIAQELIDAGKPINLFIGGHQHQPFFYPVRVGGKTAILEAGYHGRWLGRADILIDPTTKGLWVEDYKLITINNKLPADPEVAARVAYWAAIVQPVVRQAVGTTDVSLVRTYDEESNLGDLVADSMRWKADAYDDDAVNGSVDLALTNAGGLRADIAIPAGASRPYTITWGATFGVLPFGNALYLLDLTGAQLQTVLDRSASLTKGMLQVSGVTMKWSNDCHCATPITWSAFDIAVGGEPLKPAETYRVVTNDFLAGGQDGWVTFAEGTDRWNTYYDMQEGLNDYIRWHNAHIGPIDHTVDGRSVYVP